MMVSSSFIFNNYYYILIFMLFNVPTWQIKELAAY